MLYSLFEAVPWYAWLIGAVVIAAVGAAIYMYVKLMTHEASIINLFQFSGAVNAALSNPTTFGGALIGGAQGQQQQQQQVTPQRQQQQQQQANLQRQQQQQPNSPRQQASLIPQTAAHVAPPPIQLQPPAFAQNIGQMPTEPSWYGGDTTPDVPSQPSAASAFMDAVGAAAPGINFGAITSTITEALKRVMAPPGAAPTTSAGGNGVGEDDEPWEDEYEDEDGEGVDDGNGGHEDNGEQSPDQVISYNPTAVVSTHLSEESRRILQSFGSGTA